MNPLTESRFLNRVSPTISGDCGKCQHILLSKTQRCVKPFLCRVPAHRLLTTEVLRHSSSMTPGISSLLYRTKPSPQSKVADVTKEFCLVCSSSRDFSTSPPMLVIPGDPQPLAACCHTHMQLTAKSSMIGVLH